MIFFTQSPLRTQSFIQINSLRPLRTSRAIIKVACDILDGAKAIETHAGMVAEALHETEEKS